jgi:hypothetical protein
MIELSIRCIDGGERCAKASNTFSQGRLKPYEAGRPAEVETGIVLRSSLRATDEKERRTAEPSAVAESQASE